MDTQLYFNPSSLWFLTFTSADSVYTVKHHSIDGGGTWQVFGPPTSYGEISFDPVYSQTGYIGDNTYGVQKTLDGGQTWEIKSQGLTGMVAHQIDVSRIDPLRVYTTFSGWSGVYRSDDGANSWNFLPFNDLRYPGVVREDPFDPKRIYVAAGDGCFVSTDSGLSWSFWEWPMPVLMEGFPNVMEADPFQDGHLLTGFLIGSDGYHLHDRGKLYSSSDYGTTWQPITVTQELELGTITSIAFHPDTPGLVYLTSTGVYRSTDHGNTWERIDDLEQSDMQGAMNISIATHPQPMLFVVTASGYPYRSTDSGATWEHIQTPQGGYACMFLNEDSTRLYAASGFGLFFSSNAGDSWQPAAGVIGGLNITALDYAVDVENNYTILYAATTGGDSGGTRSMVVDTHQGSHTTESNLLEAGIYRYVQHIRQTFLPLAQR